MSSAETLREQYRVVVCQSPLGEEPALLTYLPDEWIQEDGGTSLRAWSTGRPFATKPPEPVKVVIEEGEGGLLKTLHVSTLWLFCREMVATLRAAGVHNLEVFDAEVTDLNRGGEVLRTHQAVNVVGVGSLEAMHEAGLRCFKLDTGGLVVHDSVRLALEASGLPMLEFDVLR